MTTIQQRDAQTVLAAIDDLLPTLRERAPRTEEQRRLIRHQTERTRERQVSVREESYLARGIYLLPPRVDCKGIYREKAN